jgi:hypothetical protein
MDSSDIVHPLLMKIPLFSCVVTICMRLHLYFYHVGNLDLVNRQPTDEELEMMQKVEQESVRFVMQ